MAEDFGSGVSRTLSARMRQFAAVVWQADNPPLDSELNLMSQMDQESLAQAVRSTMPSGFLLDPTRSLDDYQFDKSWSNFFKLGAPRTAPQGSSTETDEQAPVVWANVNGWVLPIAGTNVSVEGDTSNHVRLYPPPSSDSRIDFVFLEAWQALVQPNPSEVNKPSASTLYKYGNVLYGGTNLTDDLEDPAVGQETTKRVQIQYRVRVFGDGAGGGNSVALDIYPDGLGDPNLYGKATAPAPVTSSGGAFLFTNMREELGDPSLWRAGDGDPNNDLGTVDGYVYAIPLCAIFRRSSGTFVGVADSGNANQNGAFNRTPATGLLPDPLTGARVLTTATLTHAITATQTGLIDVTGVNGCGLEDSSLVLSSTFLVIDGEVIGISAVDTVGGTITIPVSGRGRWATDAVGHALGTTIQFFNTRPDGLFADEIAETDILDLRRAVNPGDWDYQRLLQHNLAALAENSLRSAWKRSGAGSSEGVTVTAVDYLLADGTTAVPNQTDALDGPDGIRTVFSDAASLQRDVTLLLDNEASLTGGFTATQFDATVGWDVGPDFKPTGFLNLGGVYTNAWTNGSVIFLHSGGDTGTAGARGTFRDGAERAVRFVAPREYWRSGFPVVDPSNGDQHPVSLRFLNQRSTEPDPPGEVLPLKHPGPQYPWRESNFERPFLVLGGLLRSTLKKADRTTANLTVVDAANRIVELDFGLDFDLSGGFYLKDANGDFLNDPTQVASPLLRNSRTLYGMITDDGRDRTGASSEVYVVLYGDADSLNNNGGFKVIGAGTAGYTNRTASTSTGLVLQALSPEWKTVDATFNTFTAEIRSQYTNSDSPGSYQAASPDLAIVLTDIGGSGGLVTPAVTGLSDHPWNATTLGAGDGAGLDLSIPFDGGAERATVSSKAVINLTLLYHPGRGATSRVADRVDYVALRNANSTYLRQNKATLDTTFSASTGVPTLDTTFDLSHVQTWNRLPSLGWAAPFAPNYGGNVVGFTEQDREKELLVDNGSKTFIFRPFRDRQMTLRSQTGLASPSLLGPLAYPLGNDKDAGQLFTQGGTDASGAATSGKVMGFPVPQEYMPRFGRQDIPYYRDINAGGGTFLEGVNHLFTDSTNESAPVFNIIGGEDNISAGLQVKPLFFSTGTGTSYGYFGTTIGTVSNRPHYGARRAPVDLSIADPLAEEIATRLAAVHSSDLGATLKGIQLPPYLGIARLYGVYDARNYESKGGRTWQSDRVTLEADPATNLLRKDGKLQTLFILQDGARDLTTVAGDHTYIVPSDAIDITKSPNWVTGETFDDLHYVVECVVFGFSRGWIDQNNYVLVRNHNGAGLVRSDGTDFEIEDVNMTIPAPASLNDPMYVVYDRTAYQGDPFMTRAGETQTISDYEHRYGEIPVASARMLAAPIEQYDASGALQIETPNARAFEVLAAVDFYTTMGTGSVGGVLHPGTSLDVGVTEQGGSTRIPHASTDPKWRITTRAFSEGQKKNPSRASVVLGILDNDNLNPASLDHAYVRVRLLDDSIVDIYGTTPVNQAALTGDGVPVEDQFIVDVGSWIQDITAQASVAVDFNVGGDFFGGTVKLFPQTVTGALVGDTVIVNPSSNMSLGSRYGSIVLEGWVSASDTVQVKATHTISDTAFLPSEASNWTIQTQQALDFPPLLAGGSATLVDTSLTEAAIGDAVSVTYPPIAGAPAGIVVRAYVSAPGDISVVMENLSGAPFDPPSTNFTLTMYRANAPVFYQPGTHTINLRVFRTQGDPSITARNLVNTINAHPDLQRAIKARAVGVGSLEVISVPTGTEGNGVKIGVRSIDRNTGAPGSVPIQTTMTIVAPSDNRRAVGAFSTASNLVGGVNIPVNAGDGTTQLRLTGMTERFPMGILLQDSDFLGENPLGDTASAVKTSPAGIRPVQTQIPLTEGGQEATRFLGKPGTLLGMADGGILRYAAAPASGGSKRFRVYRGGGSVFVLSGDNPGGPVDWVAESFPFSLRPVLKGGVLAAKAILVRNFPETALATPVKFSDGDEIQMLVITYGILGDGTSVENGVTLSGAISPTGYGEGYAAADRYRLNGHPMLRGQTRKTPNPATIALTPYPSAVRPSGTPTGDQGGQ